MVANGQGRVVHTGQVVIDLTMEVDHMPEPGTEVFADTFALDVGGGFNVLHAIRQMDVTAEYVGGIGAGPLAEVARGALVRDGVIVSGYRETSVDTGFCVAVTDSDAERTFLSTRGAELVTPLEAYDDVRLGEGDVLYMTGYSLVDPEPRAALLRLVDRLVAEGRLGTADAPGRPACVFDPSTMAPAIPAEALESIARLHPLWTMNAREAEAVALHLGVRPEDHTMERLEAAVLALVLSQHLEACVIVRGGEMGAWLARDDNVERIPSVPVQAVDTNGAGDAHAGVLCAELARGTELAEAVHRANAAAAIAVTRHGPATSPTSAEIDLVLAQEVAGGKDPVKDAAQDAAASEADAASAAAEGTAAASAVAASAGDASAADSAGEASAGGASAADSAGAASTASTGGAAASQAAPAGAPTDRSL